MAKKLTTEEILAQARAQAAGKTSSSSEQSAEEPAAEQPKPIEQPPAAPSGEAKKLSPLEQARQQGAGGGEKKLSPLEQARQQGAGGGEKKLSPLEQARQQGAGGGEKKLSPLEQARLQGASGAAPAAKLPGEKKSAPAKAKPAVPAGERPSVEEMVKAVKQGKPLPEPSKKPVGPPPLPKKPVKAAEKEKKPRRSFLVSLVATPFALAWLLFSATSAAAVLGIARFMFPNVLVEPPSKFKVGPPSDYPLNTVSTKWTSQYGVWLVHTTSYNGQNVIYALLAVCTHLGCTPSWLDGEQKFKCPCHGSGFYMSGINFEGPAPRPLERVGLKLGADGLLEVDKSLKFQEELGQWADPNSFVGVA